MIRGKAIGVMMILGVLLLSSIGFASVKATAQFSPEEIWTSEILGSYNSLKTTPTMDINQDHKAEILVEMENYDAYTYRILLLNGSNGKVLAENVFTDTGYSESGDYCGEDATLHGITILNSQGGLLDEHYFMVFANHTDNKRISVYSVEYPSLNNISYMGIDVPDSINYMGYNIPVVTYGWRFHTLSINQEARLLYLGYYIGSYLGYQIEEIQILMMDKELNKLWEKTLIAPVISLNPYGVDIVSFNARGFHTDHEDILIVNLTGSPGNTTLEALDASTGTLMWSTQINGIYMITSPIYALPSMHTYFFDYNSDGVTDIALPTITNSEEFRVYFVSSNGNVLGYYVADGIPLFAIYTDKLVTQNEHNLIGSVDVNGDAYRDVFFVDNNTYLVCWDVIHNITLWHISLNSESYYYMPFLSTNDVNGDSVWDIYLLGGSKDGVLKGTVKMDAVNSVDGSIIYSRDFTDIIIGDVGTLGIKEVTDINNDGLQDAILVDGYYNDGSVYVNVSAISLKDGSLIWVTSVHSELNNEDYSNWSAEAVFGGDIDGDGINDVSVQLYYHDQSAGEYYTYLRILSGKDGSLMWTGKVEKDIQDAELMSFESLTVGSPWKEFDYNDDGIINEMLITTGYSVQIYALSQPIPEFSMVLISATGVILIALLRLRRRH